MKEKRSLFIRFVIGVSCIVCILLYACANEEFISNDLPTNGVTFGKNDVLTKDAAKTWFSENSLPVCEMRASDNSQGFLVRPSWNNAKEWKKGKYEVVEASLITQTSIIFYDDETSKNANWKNDSKKIKNVGRMVFLTDLETGKTRNFIMIIVGSYEYLMKKDNKLSKNNYLYREPKFDGNILFYKPDGGFINGWKYENGKITRILTPCENENNTIPVLTRSTQCSLVPVPYSYYSCPESYGTSEFGGTGTAEDPFHTVEPVIIGCRWIESYHLIYGCYYVADDPNPVVIGGNIIPPGNVGDPNTTQTAVTYSAILRGDSPIEVMENFYFEPTVYPSTPIVSVKYEIGKNNLAFQKWTLQESESPECSVTALNPGEWFVRAIITLTDTVIITNTLIVDVLYPDVYKIRDNPIVRSQMESVWQETKNAAVSGRSERGFWIFVNTSNMTFEFGETFVGLSFQCGVLANLEFTYPTDIPSNSPLVGGKYAVCFFHSHPPLTFCPGFIKGVGPSTGDTNAIPDFPGLVYDYIGVYENGLYQLIGGHNINDAADVYIYGLYRRSN